MLPAPAQLAKKLATGIIPPAVHRRRDLRREAAGVRVPMHTFARAGEARAAAGSPLGDHASQVPETCQEPSLARTPSWLAFRQRRGGTTRGQPHREFHAEHRPRSRTAVARESPAFTHCGRKATTAVTHCRDGHPLHLSEVQPWSGSGVPSGATDVSNLRRLSLVVRVSSCSLNVSNKKLKPCSSKCTAASESVAILTTWPGISLPPARDGTLLSTEGQTQSAVRRDDGDHARMYKQVTDQSAQQREFSYPRQSAGSKPAGSDA